eukprot:1228631-Alexandrium_andersonii.AAC.1
MRDFPNSICFKGEKPTFKGQVFTKHEDDLFANEFARTLPAAGVDPRSARNVGRAQSDQALED